jgi:hypothetical protein
MSVYAADGSYNVVENVGTGVYAATGYLRVTQATTQTGSIAADGSILVEVVLASNAAYGVYNARGNLRVVDATSDSGAHLYAPNGALRVTGLVTTATGPGAGVGEGMGLLLTLTQA